MEHRRESRDHGRVGQIAYVGPGADRRTATPLVPVLAGATAAVTAAGVAAALLVSPAVSDAAASTTVREPEAASIVHVNGTLTAAHDGERVLPGEIVRVGDSGAARLDTAGRHEWLTGGSSVLVNDGTHQQIRAGALVVDVRSGPGVRLLVSGTSVQVGAGDVVRAEHGFTVRIGTLAGTAEVSSTTGRSASVPALHQVRVNGDALPDDAPAPLALVDDAAERATNLPVVVDDVLLRRWARGVANDAAARPRLRAALTAYAPPVSSQCALPREAAVADQVLPLAVARSSHTRLPLGDRYGRALCYRQEGASWGVVAHLLDTTAVRTLAQVEALQTGRLLASGATGGQSTEAAPAAGSGSGAGPSGSAPAGTDGGTSGGTSSGSGGSGGGGSSGGQPAPSQPAPPSQPPSSPAPVPSVPPDTGVIGDLVGTVAGLLVPPPSPSLSGQPSGGTSSPSNGQSLGGASGTTSVLSVQVPLLGLDLRL